MRIKINRLLHYALTDVKCFIKYRKGYILSLLAVLVGGLVLGIVLSSGREAFDIDTINYIELITKGDYNVFGSFMKVLLLMLLGQLIICTSCYNKYLCFTPYVTIFYTAYRFGVRIVTLIIADKFSGVVCLITYIIPVYIIILSGFVVLACLMRAMIIDGGFYHRCNCCNSNVGKEIGRIVLCINCICIPLLVIFTIFVPCIASFILVL